MQISHFRVENYSSNKTCVELVGGVNWKIQQGGGSKKVEEKASENSFTFKI